MHTSPLDQMNTMASWVNGFRGIISWGKKKFSSQAVNYQESYVVEDGAKH